MMWWKKSVGRLALAAAVSMGAACSTSAPLAGREADSGSLPGPPGGGSSSGSAPMGSASSGASGGAGSGGSGSSSGSGAPADGGSAAVHPDAGASSGSGAGSTSGSSSGSVDGGARTPDGGAVDASGTPADAAGGGVPGVRIVGRTTAGTTGPRFEWPGVSIAARFSGTQASIQLNDGSNLNEFVVVVDGTVQPNLVTRPGTTTYPLVSGLANGPHDILIWRRTEASYGFTEFVALTGFGAGGALLPPPPAPAHRMEIVGDSISCGFGIEGTASCTNAQLESIENNYLAYGSVAARALGADVVTIAWSGIGVYRNYNQMGPSLNTMPQRYDFAVPTDTTSTWDFSKYQPEVVVINLTSNDFSVFGDPGAPYISALSAFVGHIRNKYAGAYIVLVIEWRGNGSDSATDVNAVVASIRSGGDTNIESFDIRPFANGNGCQGHPDVAGGQAMGNALASEIKRVLHW